MDYRNGKIKVFQNMLAYSAGRHGGIYFYGIEPSKIQKVCERNRFNRNGNAVQFTNMANDNDKLIACGGAENQIIGNYQLS